MDKLFFRAYRIIGKRRWLALVGLLVTIGGLLTIVRHIKFDDDISSLIPATEETQRVQQVLRSIAFTDKIVVNIRKGEAGSVEDLTRYATEFLDSLRSRQGRFIKNIQGRVAQDDVPKTLDLVYEHLPLFLEDSDYKAIQLKLSQDSIAKITAENYRTLISPTGIVAKKNIVRDPLGLSFIALKKLRRLGFEEGFKLRDGFLLNEEEENILLFITPKFSSGETNKNLPFSEALYAVQDALNAKYGTKATSEYFGAALSAVSNAKQIEQDIKFTVGIALSLLIVLLILFYRKLILPLILFAPTLFGGLLAVTFLSLIRDEISALSLGIGAILLGITLDYGLHILTHIRNAGPDSHPALTRSGERTSSGGNESLGLPVERPNPKQKGYPERSPGAKSQQKKDSNGTGEHSLRNVGKLYDDVAPAVLMSSLTTACAFLCLLFLDSQALQDLGIFAAISVLGASVFALLFIPQVYKGKKLPAAKKTILDRWAAFEWHKSKWTIAALTVLFITGIFTYGKVVFDQDITKLNYETQALLDARKRLEKLTDIGSKSLYLSTYGQDYQQVLQRNDSLYGQLEQLKESGKIVSFGSIGGLVKSDRAQRQKIDAWQRFWDSAKVDSVKQNLIVSGSELGFKPSTFSRFYSLLETDFDPIALSEIGEIQSFSVDDYVVNDENGTTITSMIKVDDADVSDIRKRFEAIPQTLLIERQHINESLLGNLKNDFNRLLGYSLIAVVLILLLFYRSLTLTLITGIPIFLTWFLTVGIMGVFHIEFNIFNIIICSFIFGLGVDYSIFMTNGLLAEYRTGIKTLATYKTSIILSVITTIAAVGVLIFAKHPVLYSVSVVSLIGIGCALFVAFTLQPLLFRLFLGDNRKRPIRPRILIHSLLSFAYFDLGGLLLSAYSWIILTVNPKASRREQLNLHWLTSKFMKSVLYTNPFISKKISNEHDETFEKPAMLIANHTSFLDILAMGMLHPKCIYLVKDHVYYSKVVGPAARLHGAYPVSGGIEDGEAYLKEKLAQGFSIIAFPEGTRSTTNKIGRFHKGAFYLAEQLDLDILPVLIHGTSEVAPKDSFIIRDGSITLEFLPRIIPDDPRFSIAYSKRAKEIGRYFRSEFRRLRNQIEGPEYWYAMILENFRHKGDALYKAVRRDVKDNASTYKEILDSVGHAATVAHISKDFGQLDLLLALDSNDRKIITFLEDQEARAILRNNYLTHNYSKITVADTVDEVMERSAQVLIIDSAHYGLSAIDMEKWQEIGTLIFLKKAMVLVEDAAKLGFEVEHKNDRFTVLKNHIFITKEQ
ncbi:MMPL family transporter [Pricia sp. S334]|uniref:MMPL family transporter n=1 Tax=Pricia mediterranea TaxID=3076079 RepID=A0ABU3L4D4_9FLAO|nr:MMPL family transporter [Pricia sp. S334]MDT7828606.1 MMPL family transporter [Pricia sp. S334]